MNGDSLFDQIHEIWRVGDGLSIAHAWDTQSANSSKSKHKCAKRGDSNTSVSCTIVCCHKEETGAPFCQRMTAQKHPFGTKPRRVAARLLSRTGCFFAFARDRAGLAVEEGGDANIVFAL